VLKTEIHTQTGAVVALLKEGVIPHLDTEDGATSHQNSFLLLIKMQAPSDPRFCEVRLTQEELEEFAAALDTMKYLY